MGSSSVVADCLALLKQSVLLARWQPDDKTIDLLWDLLDGISLAGKRVPNCKMLRWGCAKDIIGFPSTSALNPNACADSKDSSLL